MSGARIAARLGSNIAARIGRISHRRPAIGSCNQMMIRIMTPELSSPGSHRTMLSSSIHFVREYLFTLPVLAKFALGMVMLAFIPLVSRRLHIPAAVGLLLGGIVAGPYVLDIFGKVGPVADFMAELGKLLLMFFAGLEIDLALFRRARNKSIALGIATTACPCCSAPRSAFCSATRQSRRS